MFQKSTYETNRVYTTESDEKICNDLVEYVEELRENDIAPCLSLDIYRANLSQHILINTIENHLMVGYHKHDFYELTYVIGGKIYEYIENELIIIRSEQFVIFNPSVFHALYPAEGTLALNILVDESYINSLELELSEISSDNFISSAVKKKSYQIFDTTGNKEIINIAMDIKNKTWKIYDQKSFTGLLLDTQVKELILCIVESEFEKKIRRIKYGYSDYEDNIQKMLEYVRNNFKTVTVNDVCEKMGYSRMQTYRIFKKYTGLGCMEYVKLLKYNYSVYLLLKTETPIGEICKSIGFEKTYFFRFIKNKTGLTPLQYRKTHKNEMSI